MQWINVHAKAPEPGTLFIGSLGQKIFFCTRVLTPGLDPAVVRGIWLSWDADLQTWGKVEDDITYWTEGTFPPSKSLKMKKSLQEALKRASNE